MLEQKTRSEKIVEVSGNTDPVVRARELKEKLLKSKIIRMRSSNSGPKAGSGLIEAKATGEMAEVNTVLPPPPRSTT